MIGVYYRPVMSERLEHVGDVATLDDAKVLAKDHCKQFDNVLSGYCWRQEGRLFKQTGEKRHETQP